MNSELNKNLGEIKENLPNPLKSENALCFFSDCNCKSIKSHSISESRVLSLLEYKTTNNGVAIYHLEDIPDVDFKESKSISTYQKTNRRLFLKGKDSTSIFYGFCSNCDGTIFSKLDNYNYTNQPEVNYLHCLRTLAHHLTFERNILLLVQSRLVSKMYAADDAVKNLEEEHLPKLKIVLEQIPDNYNVTWEEVSAMCSVFNKVEAIPNKELRESMKAQNQKLFEDMLNPNRYPMSGSSFKHMFDSIYKLHNEAMTIYKKSSTDEFEQELNERIRDINAEFDLVTATYRRQNLNTFSYQHISINQMFLIAGAFAYTLNNGSRILLTFFPEKETGKTHFVFGEQKLPGSNSMYLSHLNLMTDKEFKMAMSDAILTVGANVFLSPQYFDKLPQEARNLLIQDKSELKKMGFNLFAEDFIIPS